MMPFQVTLSLLAVTMRCNVNPGGNRQAVDGLDTLVDKSLIGRDFATSAHPARPIAGHASINRLNYLAVTGKRNWGG